MPLTDLDLPHKIQIKGMEDEFALVRASYTQKINSGFLLEVEVACENPDVEIEKIIGVSAVVEVAKDGPDGRPEPSDLVLNGVVVEGRWTGEVADFRQSGDVDLYVYEFLIGPFMELAKCRKDSAVFKNLGPADLIKTIANRHAGVLGAVEVLGQVGSLPVFEHIIQYRESDFDFVRRLSERYGINTLYRMDKSTHDLVLYSKNSDVGTSVTEFDLSEHSTAKFTNVSRRKTFRISEVELADYDQFKPNADQVENKGDAPAYGLAKWQEFNYPGGYPDGMDRSVIAQRRLDGIKSENEQLTAKCRLFEIEVGQRVKFVGHPSKSVNGTHVITSHSLTISNVGDQLGQSESTASQVTMLPDDIELAPRRTMSEPQNPGIVTAKVVEGSEMDPEKMGRIRVKYPFVRKEDSFWCRVAQAWAGPGLGTWVNHRVDHEVVVAFEHGDINRPIVIGSVYNGVNGNPWIDDLGDQVSGWRTQSGAGFNELLFRDKDDDELLSMIAQKNMTVSVLNDQTSAIENNQTETVAADYSKEVGGTSEWKTAGTTYVLSEGKLTIESPTEIQLVCGGSTITMKPGSIDMNTTMLTGTAAQNMAFTAGMNLAETSTNMVMTAGKKLTAMAGVDMAMSAENVATAGSKEVSVSAGEKFALEAGDEASFSSKKVNTEGKVAVNVDGKDISLKGSGKITVKASKDVVIKGSKVNAN